MADGTVDIVVGTHRLLQTGIRWKDLGLVIVDEEQRFGVEHKEHIKRCARTSTCSRCRPHRFREPSR